MLSRRKDASDRVAPVRELFAHVADWRRFHDALAASSKLQDFMDLAQGHFARSIEQRLSELPRARAVPPARRAALAQALAGALLSLMSWWLDAGGEHTPEQMDELFHRMVWEGAAAPPARAGRSAPSPH
jgi:hypothetical protein